MQARDLCVHRYFEEGREVPTWVPMAGGLDCPRCHTRLTWDVIEAAPTLQAENAALRARLEVCERLADHALNSSTDRTEALAYIRTEARAALAQGRA